MAFEELEPGVTLQWGWVHDEICDHAQAALACSNHRIPMPPGRTLQHEFFRLVINLPPGHLKSTLISVLLNAWVWLHDPGYRFISASYGFDLAVRDSTATRDLVEGQWYREVFEPDWQLNPQFRSRRTYRTLQGGRRDATSVGGRATGHRSHALILDDPLNAQEALSQTALDTASDWLSRVISTRLDQPHKAVKILIMQRLHERDSAGEWLAQGGYEHLNLSLEYSENLGCECESCKRGHTALGFTDPRSEEGELLHPPTVNAEGAATLKKDMVDLAEFESQYNQRPTTPGGNIWKTEWYRHYTSPVRLGEIRGVTMVHSWDLNTKGSTGQSRMAGDVWAAFNGLIYLLDWDVGKWDLGEACDRIVALGRKWPQYRNVVIEEAALGDAAAKMVKSRLHGVITVPVRGSKIQRAKMAAALYRSGEVYHPSESLDPRIKERELELTGFPRRTWDDMVDSTSQALAYLRGEANFNFSWV